MQKTIVFTFAVSLACAAVASAQSLGELAKQTEAARAAQAAEGRTKPVAKTYTNDSLKGVTPMPSSVTGASEPPADDAVSETRRDQIRGEIYWRTRLAPLRSLRAAYQGHYDRAVSEQHLATIEDDARPWPRQGTSLAVDLAQRSVDFWQRALDENHDHIAAIEEEARQAGALPGWLR